MELIKKGGVSAIYYRVSEDGEWQIFGWCWMFDLRDLGKEQKLYIQSESNTYKSYRGKLVSGESEEIILLLSKDERERMVEILPEMLLGKGAQLMLVPVTLENWNEHKRCAPISEHLPPDVKSEADFQSWIYQFQWL